MSAIWTPIISLFYSSGPPNIPRFVMPVIINSIKRMFRRWFAPKFGIKRFVRVKPKLDPSASIIFISRKFGIGASLFGAVIAMIFRRVITPVFKSVITIPFSGTASAPACAAGQQVACYHLPCTTFTSTQPSNLATGRPVIDTENFPSSTNLSRQILSITTGGNWLKRCVQNQFKHNFLYSL